MNSEEIEKIIDSASLPDSYLHSEYLETPQAFVILSDNYAFKIWKPEKTDEYDHTTLENRKKVCKKEVKLNEQLSSGLYEKVIPLKRLKGISNDSSVQKEVVDYAVKMKRLDYSGNFFFRLKGNRVQSSDIKILAKAIARFHKSAREIRNSFNLQIFNQRFAELKRCNVFIEELNLPDLSAILRNAIETVNAYIRHNRYYLQERENSGMIKNCHGNLTADNIFLEEKPVIMGRILFHPELRYMDVLKDLARLGVDLDYYFFEEYDRLLLQHYLREIKEQEPYQAGTFYTFYKTFVVGMLIGELIDATTPFTLDSLNKNKLLRYFNLMESYCEQLKY